MLRHRLPLMAVAFVMAPDGFGRADDAPKLRASRKEKEARVVAFSPDGRSLITSGAYGFRLRDAATARVRYTVPSPGKTWGNYGWKFSPDGRALAIFYRTGSNVSGPGNEEPLDRPMTVEVWEIPAR